MKKNNLKYILVGATSLFPSFTFAALGGLKGLIGSIGSLLNSLIPIIFALCLIYFFWGISQFILHAGEEKTRAEGKNKMIWGVVALFIFISIYGILSVIANLTGVPTNTSSSYFPIYNGLNDLPSTPGPF